jgi:hypothetical protein
MATTKKRTISRKKSPVSTGGALPTLARVWKYSKTHPIIVVVFISVALIAAILNAYAVYSNNVTKEMQAAADERANFVTLSKVLATLKPELENALPDGPVWAIDERCTYTYQAIREGDRSCQGNLKAVTSYTSDTDMKALISRIDAVLDKHPQYFHTGFPAEYPSTDPGLYGHSARGGHAFVIENMNCGNSFTIPKSRELNISIGCRHSSARQEYYSAKP